MPKKPDSKELCLIANTLRADVIRMLLSAKSGHSAGPLGMADIFAAMYFRVLNHDPKNPKWPGRDRFLLSKGHACPALYATLAEKGYFNKEDLSGLRKLGSKLQGHPQIGLAGIEISSGSLGQGLSIANGMALAARLDKSDSRIYCLMGDGETNEGQVWEAAMTAAHYKLDHVCAIVDFNKLQIDGFCCDIKDMGPYVHKWADFGWNVIEVDGHDIEELMDAFDKAGQVKGKPTVIIAHTIKGKGVSFMENKAEWHGIAPRLEEYERAVKELDVELSKIT